MRKILRASRLLNTPYDIGSAKPLARSYRLTVLSAIHKTVILFLHVLFWAQAFVGLAVAADWAPRIPLVIIFTVLVILSAFTGGLLTLASGKTLRFDTQEVISVSLLLWVSCIQLLSYFDAGLLVPDYYIQTIGTTLVGSWAAFLAGRHLARASLVVKGLTWLIPLFTLGVGVTLGYLYYGQLFFAFLTPEGDQKANYLILGDSLAVSSIILMGELLKTKRKNFPMLFSAWSVSMIALFLSFSRTSFVFGALSLTLLWFRNFTQALAFALFASLLVIGIAWISLIDTNANALLSHFQIASSRITALVTGEDASLQERLILAKHTWDYLAKFWLLGRFLYEVTDGEGAGMYVHNWLSFWISYGLGPFLVSLTLYALLFRNALKRRDITGVGLLLFAALAMAFSRSHVWPFFWFIVAYMSTPINRRHT